MWLLTPIGFFSAVRKTGDSHLTLRARVHGDLEALRARYVPQLSPTLAGGGTDYPYRATCTHAQWASALAQMAQDIDYDNFKTEVAHRQGYDRAHVYSKVWSALTQLESLPQPVIAPPPKSTPERHPSGLKRSYGGVIVRADGKVLLREVKNHFDREGWTFSKGNIEPGETSEQAAVRETLEETGWRTRVVCALPGEYRGSSSMTAYYLLQPVEDTGAFNTDETAGITWAAPEEARRLIRSITTKKTALDRDLAVLERAMEAFGASSPSTR